MHHRTTLSRPPASAGANGMIQNGDSRDVHSIASSSSPRSANDETSSTSEIANQRAPTYKSKESDMSNGMPYTASDNGTTQVVPSSALPGRPRRRPHPSHTGADARFFRQRKGMHNNNGTTLLSNESSKSSNQISSSVPIPVAILSWYLLGVISIASSKVLLSTNNVPPLLLTLQQLIIGMNLLQFMLRMQSKSTGVSGADTTTTSIVEGKDKRRIENGGVQPIPMQSSAILSGGVEAITARGESCEIGSPFKRKSSNASATLVESTDHGIISAVFALILSKCQLRRHKQSTTQRENQSTISIQHNQHIHTQLLLAALYFALGFLLTNYGFQSGSAAFVETIKAAEPITSATTAVMWGIERLEREEIMSLGGIVVGVVLSTLSHRGDGKVELQKPVNDGSNDVHADATSLIAKCFIVMLANLCFSFRGLHQKLFRATPQGKASVMDDLNLQYRMQQIGVMILIVPAVLGNASLITHQLKIVLSGGVGNGLHYLLLSTVNGFAFTSYNLASTYVLTRISVVHHAALNCIRRVFAIVITSIVFGLAITPLQIVGICTSVSGFFAYTHHKMKRAEKARKRKEMRRKYGVEMRPLKRSAKKDVESAV
mmetsp:Transcript_3560/g.7903  ORF Transcript_3560/g.7903 Transcript_3560/m.7903 type:complete len:603 (-) Transcript_3560:2129-3937(-)